MLSKNERKSEQRDASSFDCVGHKYMVIGSASWEEYWFLQELLALLLLFSMY